jgi:hypothetical protein
MVPVPREPSASGSLPARASSEVSSEGTPAAADGPLRRAGHRARGPLSSREGPRDADIGPETWRTPWSAAGCNKPATGPAEQTAEAGRNGKGGTSSKGGNFEPKVVPESWDARTPRGSSQQEALRSQDIIGSGRWAGMSTEGRTLTTPREEVPIRTGSSGDEQGGLRAPTSTPPAPGMETDRANRNASPKERRRSRGSG